MSKDLATESRWLAAARYVMGLWVVLLVLALTPYTADPAAPVKFLITGWALVLVTGMVWLAVVISGERVRFAWPASGFLAAFLGVYLAATVMSVHPAFAWNTLCTWFLLALVTLAAAQVYRSPEQVWHLFGAVIAAVAVSSVYGFFQAWGLDPFPWSQTKIEEYRGLPSTYANPNFAGHALVLAILLAGGALWRGMAAWREMRQDTARRDKILAALTGLALLIMGTHLYLTRMRGGRLALLAVVAWLVLFVVLRRRTVTPTRAGLWCGGIAVAAILAGAAALVTVLPAAYRNAPLPMDGSLTLRLNGYHGVARMILDRPVLGFGPGNYELENIPYWTPFEKHWFAAERKKNNHVHNDVLESAVDAGLPGAAAYLALLCWGFLSGVALTGHQDRERRRLGYVLAACFVAFGVDGLFGFNLRVPVSAGLIFLLLGVTEALARGEGRGVRRPVLGQTALVIAALFCAVTASRAFYAELMLQRGKGGRYWASEYRKQGDAARETRALRDAYTYVERGRKVMPWDARFPELEGQLALTQRNLDDAIARFEQALRLHPHHPDIMISLAQAHLNRALAIIEENPDTPPDRLPGFGEHLAAAESAADQARQLCEPYAEAHEALGRAKFFRALAKTQAGESVPELWKEVAAEFDRALQCGAPDRATLQRMLGQAHLNARETDAAEQAFRLAAESDPTNEETWQLFYLLSKNDNRSRAFMDALGNGLRRLKAQDPVPARAVGVVSVYLADLYAADPQNRPLARTTLREALALDPAQAYLWGSYASLLPRETRLADLQAAMRELSKDRTLPPVLMALHDLDPANGDSVTAACRLLAEAAAAKFKEGRREAVGRDFRWLAGLLAETLDQITIPDAAKGTALAALGSVYGAAGQWEEVDRVLARAVPLLPAAEQITPLINRSEALAALKRVDEALALAREAAKRGPASVSARWNLARRLSEAGRLAEARFEYASMLDEVSKQSPAYARIRNEYQAVEQRLGAEQGGGTS
jgi:putative inorganic carbon (HCO3(-)) transporter